jgi:hypothetical protein
MSRVAVVTYLWGDWPDGDKGLGRSYAERLKSSFLRNTVGLFDWVEFNEGNIPVEFLAMEWNLTKMYMYSGCLKAYDWVVCLDLDLVLTGSLDFLLKHRSDNLVTCRGAYRDMPGGSVIGFNPNADWVGYLVYYLKENLMDVERFTNGSERLFYRLLRDNEMLDVEYWQDSYPGRILSYKGDGFRDGASIVRFHGEPRPHQVDDAWVKEHWR